LPDVSRLQLAPDDFKGIYYRDKFGVHASDTAFISTVKQVSFAFASAPRLTGSEERAPLW
jgi:hypothetical protein